MIAVIVLTFAVACRKGSPTIIPIDTLLVYTKEELANACWEYKEELNEVAKIVLENEAFERQIRNSREGDGSLIVEGSKVDYTDEEWEAIVDLFNKIRPYMLMRDIRNGDNVFYITFFRTKIDDGYISTTLYYFQDADAVERYQKNIWVGALDHIDGGWYVGEDISDW